jgi:hypothetical protein
MIGFSQYMIDVAFMVGTENCHQFKMGPHTAFELGIRKTETI